MAQNVTGTFTGTGQSVALLAKGIDDRKANGVNISLWGTFVATVRVERNLDGTNWLPLTAMGSPINFSGPVSEIFDEQEAGAQYRLNCTSYTSGTVSYRMSQ